MQSAGWNNPSVCLYVHDSAFSSGYLGFEANDRNVGDRHAQNRMFESMAAMAGCDADQLFLNDRCLSGHDRVARRETPACVLSEPWSPLSRS